MPFNADDGMQFFEKAGQLVHYRNGAGFQIRFADVKQEFVAERNCDPLRLVGNENLIFKFVVLHVF